MLKNERARVLGLAVFGVFLFICSLEGVEYGFKCIFSEWQAQILSMINAEVAPLTGLATGMLSTALVQSSSAVIAATMVSMAGLVAGGLPLSSAISFGVPMVLGANIGTTITNTIAVFGIKRATTPEEFKSTIPGVIIDDIFKILTVSLLFTLEITTSLLSRIVVSLGDFLMEALRLEKIFASFEKSLIDILVKDPIIVPLGEIFRSYLGNQLGGIFIFAMWFGAIVFSMSIMIKGMNSMIETEWEDRVTSAFKSPFKSFTTGFSITWLTGSSSIGTSLVIPFLATRAVNLEKVYPYVCGCALATTMDLAQIYGYIAAGTVGIMLGSAHIILTILGLLLWLISPLRSVPLRISNSLGGIIASNRHSALLLLAYVISVFIVLPMTILFVFK